MFCRKLDRVKNISKNESYAIFDENPHSGGVSATKLLVFIM